MICVYAGIPIWHICICAGMELSKDFQSDAVQQLRKVRLTLSLTLGVNGCRQASWWAGRASSDLETHLDGRAPSESAFPHTGDAFGSASVERKPFLAYQKTISTDGRRAGAHLTVGRRCLFRSLVMPTMRFARQASIESETTRQAGEAI